MEALVELFLCPAALERLLTYMCKSGTGSLDPISDSVRALLSCPVQFSVSRYGMGILKGHPVFPYCYMTPEQRQWTYELVRAIAGGENHHSAFARRDDPLTFTVSGFIE
jgi:hypothetical protein